MSARDSQFKFIPGLVYFGVSFVLLIAKFFAYTITSSEAIFSDAMESIVNVIAAGLTFYVLYRSRKPDPKFPYGTGKLEYLASSTEGGLLAFASLTIIFETIPELIHQTPVQQLNTGLIIIATTGFINFLLGIFLKQQSKKYKSIALEMSGTHILSDVLTTVGIILGLLIVKATGWFLVDSLLALAIALFIGYLSFKHLRSAIKEMLDKEDLNLLKKLEVIFNKISQEGFIQIHKVKIIRSGSSHHIDAHFVLPEFWDVQKVHSELNELEKHINKLYDYKVEIGAHIDPCRRAYCKHCDISSCDIRKEKFVSKLKVSLEQMRSPIEPEPFVDSSSAY